MSAKKYILSIFVILLVLIGGAAIFFISLTSPVDDIIEFEKYRPSQIASQVNESLKVSYYGVSTLAIDDGETTILIDSFFSRPTSFDVLFGELISSEKESLAGLNSIGANNAKAIFFAHSHYDHALDLVATYNITKAHIHGSNSTLNIARGGNVPEDKLHLIDGGKTVQIGDFKVTIIRSKHSVPPNSDTHQENESIDKPLKQPSTNVQFAMGGNFDFLIEHSRASILVKGSANYVPGAFKGLNVDALFIGTAQLGIQSKEFQQAFIEESINAVSPEIIVPLHWDNFVQPWQKKGLEFNPKIVDHSPAKGLQLLIDYAEANLATFYLLQSTETLWIKKSVTIE